MRFSEIVSISRAPADAQTAVRTPLPVPSQRPLLGDDISNSGFVSRILGRRSAGGPLASRRTFLRSTITAAAAVTAASAANLFGPARKVEAQTGVVGTYPRRILQFCPPYNANDNCQPGCGSSPICTDCCGSDGFFRNDPANGYTLYPGGCGDGDIADGWIWRYAGACGNCASIEYRCSDGYVQTDTGPAPFICRAVTFCEPLPDGAEPGPDLADAARPTNWRPAGSLESAVDNGGSVSIYGWIADGSGSPVSMRITSNGSIVHFGAAGLARPDIASAVRGAGPNTGFAVTFPVEPGTYRYCVDALAGPLTATVGCVTLQVGSGAAVRGPGSTGSIPAPAAAPGDASLPESDSPPPAPTPGEIIAPTRGPSSEHRTGGALQVLRRRDESTGFASGWAADVDSEDPVIVAVEIDGERAALGLTDLPRADVAAAFPEVSAMAGFALSFPLPAEQAEVCVSVIDPLDGRVTNLGCRTLGEALEASSEGDGLAEPSASGPRIEHPATVFGAVDEVTPTRRAVEIAGFAFDPDDRERPVEITCRTETATVSAPTDRVHQRARAMYALTTPCGFAMSLALDPGSHVVTTEARAADGAPVLLARHEVEVR